MGLFFPVHRFAKKQQIFAFSRKKNEKCRCKWAKLKNLFNLFKFLDVKKRRQPLRIANVVKEWFASTDVLWSKLNPNLCNSSFKNLFCFWAKIVFLKSIFVFVSKAVDVSRKSMPSGKLCQKLL